MIDGVWQESPDHLAVFADDARGCLYLLTEVDGPPGGRAALEHELIETAHREYVASRGSITLALNQAVRAANSFFYDVNANTAREARRIAGLSAATLRERELFVAQGGPGVVCLVRGRTLRRFPEESPWFTPGPEIEEFPTPGTVPLGLRRDYTPDLFHLSLEPGDVLLLATRYLVHLLSDEELLDALADRPPDEIVDRLEDIAGSTNLAAFAIRLPREAPTVQATPASRPAEVKPAPASKAPVKPASPAPASLALPAPRPPANAPRPLQAGPHAPRPPIAKRIEAMASSWNPDWDRLQVGFYRGANHLLRWLIYALILSARAFLPEPSTRKARGSAQATVNLEGVWHVAVLVLPVLLIGAAGAAWVNFRVETVRAQEAQFNQWVKQANTALDAGKDMAKTDPAAARDQFTRSITFAQQARNLNPNQPAARDVLSLAQDQMDMLNGISIVASLPKFATFADAKSNPTRIIAHWPDIFILDRGLQRILRYVINDAGSAASPASGDGVILKAGDKVGDYGVGELIDIVWIDSGRLVALDRGGLFLYYEPIRGSWTTRLANDTFLWPRVSLAASYMGNLYLLDPSRNQIIKYTAGADGNWSSAVAYLAPGVNVDLSTAVDMVIDGDVWVLRPDGSLWRFTAGKLVDFSTHDLDVPLSKATSLFTSSTLVGLYVVDAGNQRIVQFDKVTGKFARQFRPRAMERDAFSALKAVAVDEANKRLFVINGNQAYLAMIPQ